jgi:hypothetical protein
MLTQLWEFIHNHHRSVGIWGDSLTFAGGLFLSAEALFKKKDRLAIAVKSTVATLLPGAEEKSGEKVSPTDEEKKQLNRWDFVAKGGIGMLTIGFLILLLLRISE